jgi:hypothetical protein
LPTLGQFIARRGPEFLARKGVQLPADQRRALQAILRCRTPALGGHRCACTHCGGEHFRYHSCNHRMCPTCGGRDTDAWLQRQMDRLLPAPYFLVTFTVPQELREVARRRPGWFYTALFEESSRTLQEIAADPRHLGAELGLLGVLHTWSRQLILHPHIHYIVVGGGLAPERDRWISLPQSDYLLPEAVLAARFRTRLRARLEAQSPELYAQLPGAVWRKDWVVDCEAVGSGAATLKYLAQYVFRTAMSGSRELTEHPDGRVSFQYTDSDTKQPRTCTLPSDDFLRRFLQHVLPAGTHRVRYFGWLHPSAKKRRLLVETLLSAPILVPPKSEPPPDWHRLCPHCGNFTLIVVEKLPRSRAPP